jgi:hypothetical protein
MKIFYTDWFESLVHSTILVFPWLVSFFVPFDDMSRVLSRSDYYYYLSSWTVVLILVLKLHTLGFCD